MDDVLVTGIPFISPYNVHAFLNPLLVQVLLRGERAVLAAVESEAPGVAITAHAARLYARDRKVVVVATEDDERARIIADRHRALGPREHALEIAAEHDPGAEEQRPHARGTGGEMRLVIAWNTVPVVARRARSRHARTVCRRAEREVIAHFASMRVDGIVTVYSQCASPESFKTWLAGTDIRIVHVDPLTPESEGGISLKKIAPKARVY